MIDKTDLDFLLQVDALARSSKDRSTGIGAILLHPDFNYDIIVGNNHLTQGIPDDDHHSTRPQKYLYWEHAERTVIYLAAKNGFRTQNCTLYTTGIPCADCARAVVEAGLTRVVVWKRGSGLEATDRWADSIKAGREILVAAAVEITEIPRP